MSVHLERARLLLAQSRPADAEREALAALALDPANPNALAVLALSRVDQRKPDAALEAATEAVGIAPDHAYFHYVHAFVLHQSHDQRKAFVAVQEALRLDPHDADLFSLLAAIEIARNRWTEALAASEQALAINAEHVEAANFRAMALIGLGRKDEAMQTVDFALQREPDNAMSHSNQGWNCLHKNDPKAAQVHFREALRLAPELDHARTGLLEALKARNPVYRGMLAYFMWIGRQSTKFQWAFVIGSFFLFRIVNALPNLHPGFWVLVGLAYLFFYLSWTAVPMFNLLLRLDRFGRYVLTEDQRMGSTWFGLTLLASIGCFVASIFASADWPLVAGFMLLVLTICVAATFLNTGKSRLILGVATLALAALGGYSCYLYHHGPEDALTYTYIGYFGQGFLAFQIGSMFLRR